MLPFCPVPLFKIRIGAGGPSIWSRPYIPMPILAAIAHQPFPFAAFQVCSWYASAICVLHATMTRMEVVSEKNIVKESPFVFRSLTPSQCYGRARVPVAWPLSVWSSSPSMVLWPFNQFWFWWWWGWWWWWCRDGPWQGLLAFSLMLICFPDLVLQAVPT